MDMLLNFKPNERNAIHCCFLLVLLFFLLLLPLLHPLLHPLLLLLLKQLSCLTVTQQVHQQNHFTFIVNWWTTIHISFVHRFASVRGWKVTVLFLCALTAFLSACFVPSSTSSSAFFAPVAGRSFVFLDGDYTAAPSHLPHIERSFDESLPQSWLHSAAKLPFTPPAHTFFFVGVSNHRASTFLLIHNYLPHRYDRGQYFSFDPNIWHQLIINITASFSPTRYGFLKFFDCNLILVNFKSF